MNRRLLVFVASCAACVDTSSPRTSGGGDLIGPEGGVIRYQALTVAVPPGALAKPVRLAVHARPPPHGAGAFGPWYEIEPSGLVFDRPVRVHVAAPVDSRAHVALFTDNHGHIRPLALFNPAADGAEAFTRHLSGFGPGELQWPFAEGNGSVSHNGVHAEVADTSSLWLSASHGLVQLGFAESTSGVVRFSGLPPGERWFIIQLPQRDEQEVEISASGELTVEAASAWWIRLQPRPSTRVITDACTCLARTPEPSGTCPPTPGDTASWNEGARTCTLLTDLNEPVELTDGVTLDCAGHAIHGPGSGVGVTWFGGISATLRGCTVTGFSSGVWLVRLGTLPGPSPSGGPGGVIDSVIVPDAAVGLQLTGASSLTVNASSFSTTVQGGQGIALWAHLSSGVTITSPTAMTASIPGRTGYSFLSTGSDHCRLRGVTVTGDAWGPAFVPADASPPGLELSDSTVANLPGTGVTFLGDWSGLLPGDRPKVFHNNIFGNDAGGAGFQIGSLGPLELSFGGEGSYWGRGYPPAGGFQSGPLFVPGVDSSRTDMVDQHPFCRQNGWLNGELPCQCDAVPVSACTDDAGVPTAALVATPPQGTTDTRFVFDASGSRAPAGGGALEYRFDLDGDLVFDTPFMGPAIYAAYFPRPGAFAPVVEVRSLLSGGLARATAGPVTVSQLPPAVTAATPLPVRVRSPYQEAFVLTLTGSGLNDLTEVRWLAGNQGYLMTVLGLTRRDGGEQDLAVQVNGVEFPYPNTPSELSLRVTNPAGFGLPASASTELTVAVDRDVPAFASIVPSAVPRYNREFLLELSGGYFYPDTTVFVAAPSQAEWRQLAVADLTRSRLVAMVPEMTLAELLAGYGGGVTWVTLLVINRDLAGAGLFAASSLPIDFSNPVIEGVIDRAIGRTDFFDASYDGADPAMLEVFGRPLAPGDNELLVVHSEHPERRIIVPVAVAAAGDTAGRAAVPRYLGTGEPLLDAPVVLQLGVKGKLGWSSPYRIEPVYSSTTWGARAPNALQARPVTPAMGPQYLTFVGDNFYPRTRVYAGPARIALKTVFQSRHRLTVEVPSEWTGSFPDPAEPYGPPVERTAPSIQIWTSTDGAAPAPGQVPNDIVPVFYLGEARFKNEIGLNPITGMWEEYQDPLRRTPERDSAMIAWDAVRDEGTQIGHGALPSALKVAEHKYVGGTVLTYFDDIDPSVPHAQLSFWSRPRVFCLAVVRDPAVPREVVRFRLSRSTSQIHLDPGDDVRRYTTPDFGNLLSPGFIYEYSIVCSESASATSYTDVLAHTTYFRVPDSPMAPPALQRPVSFAVVSDVAWCSRWREEHWGKCPTDSGGETAKHKLQTWRIANVLSRYFYHGAVDFLAAAGDLSEADNQTWTYFERFLPYFEPVMAGAPLFAIQGNHDIAKPETSSDEYFAVFNLPMHDPAYDEAYDQWTLERVRYHTYESKYYALHYGTVGLAAFDHPWVTRWSLRANFGWLYPTYRVVNYYDDDNNLISVSPLPDAFGKPTPQWS